MADIKVNEFEYFQFFGSVKDLLKDLENVELNSKTRKRIEAVQSYIDDKETIRGLMKERNLYYNSFIEKKDSDPQMAAVLYKSYLDRKNQIDKLNKNNNLLNKVFKNMEEEHEQ